ncbi:hypothetical protein EDB37_10143 [Vibrio crassostreae]|nr:hypothetical protein EDB37_10143 [Vibrio crassostreae]
MGAAYNLTNLELIKLIFQSSACQVSVQNLHKLNLYPSQIYCSNILSLLPKTIPLFPQIW